MSMNKYGDLVRSSVFLSMLKAPLPTISNQGHTKLLPVSSLYHKD